MRDVTVLGRAGVDLYSLDFSRELKDVRTFAKYVGGGAANISTGLARLGLSVSIVTKVGDEDLGEYVLEYLSSQGVDVSHSKKTRDGRTGIVFAEIRPGKEGKFVFYRENAADLLIRKEDIDETKIEDSRVLVTTGTALSANPSRDSTLYAMQIAKNSGRESLFNLDWRPTLWKEDPLPFYKKALDFADIVVGNEKEFKAATGADSLDEAISHLKQGKQKLLLTRGENGSRLYGPGGVIEVPPFKVDWIKGLGAGDGLIAGYLFGHLRSWDDEKSLKFANAVAAIVVSGHSCSDSMPSLDQAMRFIKQNGGL